CADWLALTINCGLELPALYCLNRVFFQSVAKRPENLDVRRAAFWGDQCPQFHGSGDTLVPCLLGIGWVGWAAGDAAWIGDTTQTRFVSAIHTENREETLVRYRRQFIYRIVAYSRIAKRIREKRLGK